VEVRDPAEIIIIIIIKYNMKYNVIDVTIYGKYFDIFHNIIIVCDFRILIIARYLAFLTIISINENDYNIVIIIK